MNRIRYILNDVVVIEELRDDCREPQEFIIEPQFYPINAQGDSILIYPILMRYYINGRYNIGDVFKCVIERIEESESFDPSTHDELQAVSNMIERAKREGLLVEVVWQLAMSNHGEVKEKCAHALHEWDC